MLELQNKNTYFNTWISKLKGRRRMARNLKKIFQQVRTRSGSMNRKSDYRAHSPDTAVREVKEVAHLQFSLDHLIVKCVTYL